MPPTAPARAQEAGAPPSGPGLDGPRLPASPIITALDLNGDGIIDADELAKAGELLKKLDKIGDGKLTSDEYRPQRLPAGRVVLRVVKAVDPEGKSTPAATAAHLVSARRANSARTAGRFVSVSGERRFVPAQPCVPLRWPGDSPLLEQGHFKLGITQRQQVVRGAISGLFSSWPKSAEIVSSSSVLVSPGWFLRIKASAGV